MSSDHQLDAQFQAQLDQRMIESMSEAQVRSIAASALARCRDLSGLLAAAYGDLGKLRVELALAKAPPSTPGPKAEHLSMGREVAAQLQALRQMKAALGGA